jgi:octaprenyl-diphosphate synthase
MSDNDALLKLLENDREKIDSTIRLDIADLEKTFDDQLTTILRYGLLEGGKRVRPLLAVISARLCGQPIEQLYTIAIAFEYLHAATLFHDDVIDQAGKRRGKPSVYKKYGIEAAILAGDFLHARSMEIIGRYGGAECLNVFCKATATMVDGEFLQLAHAKNFTQSEMDYFRTIEGKTALLISAATEIGAICGGADNQKRVALMEYGRNLGFGFQIVDDLLDYLGDPEKTGKAVGNDLEEGKMTLPLIIAMRRAEEGEKSRLRDILQDQNQRRKSFDLVYAFIEKYDGFELTRKKAEQFVNKAIKEIQIFGSGNRDVEVLTGLAQYVLARKK